MRFIEIVSIVYEANRRHCQNNGDFSFKPWNEHEEWQEKTIINGIKFHINNPECTCEQSHENWIKHKLESGWSYGEEKSEHFKTHPCIVPYEDLPENQKIKDYLFKAIVQSLITFLDKEELDRMINK